MSNLTKGLITTLPINEVPVKVSLESSRFVQISAPSQWAYGYEEEGPYKTVNPPDDFTLEDYKVNLDIWVKCPLETALTIEVLS